MTKKQKVWYAAGGILVCAALGACVAYWLTGRQYGKVAKLVDQLSSSELSRGEYNQVKLELMRTMDEMPRDKVRDVYSRLRDKQREDERKKIEAFHTATDAEKNVILDDALNGWQQGREIMGALRTDMARRRRGGRGGRGRERGTDERRRQRDSENRPQEEVEAERKQRRVYYDALRKRAEELGKGDLRGRGDRRGGERR